MLAGTAGRGWRGHRQCTGESSAAGNGNRSRERNGRSLPGIWPRESLGDRFASASIARSIRADEFDATGFRDQRLTPRLRRLFSVHSIQRNSSYVVEGVPCRLGGTTSSWAKTSGH